MAAVNKGNQEE